MRLDRRQFHSLALAFLANGIVAHGARATALDPAADRAVIALNRLSFGASAAAIEAFNSLGKQAWLDRQLSLRPEDDTALARRLASRALGLRGKNSTQDMIGTINTIRTKHPNGFICNMYGVRGAFGNFF